MSTYMFIRRDRAQSRKKHKEKKTAQNQ